MKRTVLLLCMTLVFSCPVQAVAEETTKLKEVIVTATRTEKDPQEVTQTVSVINREEIARSGATDVATMVQNAAGVHIGNYGTPGSVESLSIRGAYSSQVLVLLDGIRMNSSRDGGFDLSFIPVALDDIERIEIVRGPSSALYGSDAVGGVINIITRKPAVGRTEVRASAGSHAYRDLFVSDAGRKDQWYYAASLNRGTADGYRVNSDLDQWIYAAKGGYAFSKISSLELAANHLDKESGSPGSTIFGATPRARQHERNTMMSATYNGRITDVFDAKVSVYRKKDDLSFKDPDVIDFTTFLPAPVDSRHKSTSTGLDLQATWLIAAWNQLTAGYELKRDSIDSTDSGAHSSSNNAFYFQDEVSMGEQVTLILGGRQDKHSVYGGKFSPKAGARVTFPSTETTLRASYGESFRAPTFNDLYFNSSWGVGNPNLKPESAREYEAGIEQKAGKNAFLKLTGFDRKVRNLIQWDWSVFPMTVTNIGRARIRGYEVEAAYRTSDVLAFTANYTYTNPVDEVTGEKIYYTIPKTQTKAGIVLTPVTPFTLAFEGRMVENYVKQGEAAWRYSVLDSRAAIKIGKEQRNEVFVAVNNVFDRCYEAVQGYPMPPREWRGGFSVSF